MSAPVVADHLSRAFDGTTVVEDVSLDVAEGHVHGFIGPSGSGKTTTVRMLCGVLPPTGGAARVFGNDPMRLGTADRQRIGYMPQLGVLYPELTIGDNLRFVASLYGVAKPKGRIREVLELLDMGGTMKLRLDQASGGMQRRVALAGVLLHDPDLLFLDEPTAGLDPVLRRTVWDHLRELAAGGRTVVVTTQIISEAASCDAVSLIADGRIRAEGTPESLRRTAAGGEVVDLHVDRPLDDTAVEVASAVDGVTRTEAHGPERRTLRIVVADPEAVADVIDRVGAAMAAGGVEIRLTERYQLPFDDVFVQILEDDRG